MNFNDVIKENQLHSYIKEIFVFENEDETKKSLLPFFADGYPGIMFQQSGDGAFLFPGNKNLSHLFLYGQTINPIEIYVEGCYTMIIFQLYPSTVKTVFKIKPKELNDDCYDLSLVKDFNIKPVIKKLTGAKETKNKVEIIASFLSKIVWQHSHTREQIIKRGIDFIHENKGRVTVKALTDYLNVTERTLQRLFIDYIGVSPEQFAKITRFQSSFNQVSQEAFSKFTEIVYENGYADQSHFIRNFKKFTGKRPSQFKQPK